jgi:hypothetical protein
VRALLEEGHSLEFFIEGGRSRDGRVNSPKLGILSYVVDAVLDGGPGAKASTCMRNSAMPCHAMPCHAMILLPTS